MNIRFERITDERHRLRVDHDAVELETKSLLVHDLLHYAVEKEARLTDGFWGHVAGGRTFASMKGFENETLRIVEMVVGGLHPTNRADWSGQELVTGLVRFLDVSGEPIPTWVSAPMVDAAKERMRKMIGEWNATGALVLEWP